jgi:hypothetical protein
MQEELKSGEKELRKIYEDTITRNVKTISEFSKGTRRIIHNLEKRVELLEETIREQNSIMDGFKLQLSNVQLKLFSGGTE